MGSGNNLSDQYIKIPEILKKVIDPNSYSVMPLGCSIVTAETCKYDFELCGQGCFSGQSCNESCSSSCEKSCQSSCEKSSQCGSCQSSSQGCNLTCEKSAQCVCLSAQSCSTSCQDGCEYYCQTYCQLYIECGTCQANCQSTCEKSSQGCSSTCESGCQTACQKSSMGECTNCEACLTQCQLCLGSRQDGCDVACMVGCEELCESTQTCSCQHCQTCQDCQYCESICQYLCEKAGASCQYTCTDFCQALCEHTGEPACQNACQDDCQSGGCQTNTELIWGDVNKVTAPTESGSLTVIAIGTDYITVSLTAISDATYYKVAYRPSSTTSATYFDSESLTVTITGLTPNTEYVVNYRGFNRKGAGPYMPQGVTVKTRPIGVWEWYSDIAKGVPMGCLVCEAAAEHTNGIKVIPAYEWRDFCNMINDVRRLKKLSSYYFTNPVDGHEFTAAVFNEAVSAIQDMNSAVSSVRVTSGNQILASSFLDIRDRLNECVTITT